MEFNRLSGVWMGVSAAKLNMHYSVRPAENSESTLHTGVGGKPKLS